MKSLKTLLYIFVSCALVILMACNRSKEANELAHDHAHHHEADGHHHHHDDEDEEEDAITIAPETAQKLGIDVQQAVQKPFAETIKVSGTITAPPSTRKAIVARSSGIVSLNRNTLPGARLTQGQTIATINGENIAGGDVLKTLSLEYEAAKKELDRITPLYEKGIISAKDYNAAKSLADKAHAALGSVSSSSGGSAVTSPMPGTLISVNINDGDYIEAGQTIGYVGDNALLSLKADLPRRYHNKAYNITDAFIIPSCGDCQGFAISEFEGRRQQGNSAVNDNVAGFIPIYFTFRNNGNIDGSSFVDTYLILDSQHQAITVPNEALVEQQGSWFAFIRLDEDCYEKRPVNIGGTDGKNTEIISGINEGEEVVTKGVTFVHLAESAGNVPEGHSHTH